MEPEIENLQKMTQDPTFQELTKQHQEIGRNHQICLKTLVTICDVYFKKWCQNKINVETFTCIFKLTCNALYMD